MQGMAVDHMMEELLRRFFHGYFISCGDAVMFLQWCSKSFSFQAKNNLNIIFLVNKLGNHLWPIKSKQFYKNKNVLV